MPRMSALAAPLALTLSCAAGGGAGFGVSAKERSANERADQTSAVSAPFSAITNAFDPLQTMHEGHVVNQVRIEQRVVVRISPQPLGVRQELAAQSFERELTNRYEEKRIGKCLPLEGIAAVQTGSGNRIVLYLRDQRMISLSLEKSCRARDFYSGFYVERHKDGRLCVDRDQLQSRTGVKCGVERLHQLVEVKD
jgi:hypothetical protein